MLVKPQTKSRKNINTASGQLGDAPSGNDSVNGWYKACVQITLTNCKPTYSRIKVWTDKRIWLADDPEVMLMHKVRSAVHSKATDIGIDLRTGIADVYMKCCWPWALLWKSLENEVNKIKIKAMELSIAKMKRISTMNKSLKSAPWERGSAFSNREAKSYAKQAVLDELEARSDKKLI